MQLQNFFPQDQSGNYLPGAICRLLLAGTDTLATGLQDKNGNPLSNPFAVDSTGLAQLAAPDGEYDIRFTRGTFDNRVRVQFMDLQDFNAEFDAFLAASGFESPPIPYVDGNPLVINRPTQTISRAGIIYTVKMPNIFPFNLTGTFATDDPNLVVRNDQTLRQDLAVQNDLILGAALTGWDGEQLSAQMDKDKKIADYAAARAYDGSATRIEIIEVDKSGPFNRRPFVIGDVDNNGTVLVSTNGLWTMVRDFLGLPNPLWFGADKTGAVSSVTAFNAAAAVAGQVVVTKGTFLLGAATVDATWVLEKGVVISGLPTVGGNFLMDLSRLTGRVMAFQAGGRIGFRLGDGDPWLERDIRNFSESLAEIVGVSSQGCIGALFASRSSDNPTPNMSTIGAAFYGVNDNLVNPESAWSTYYEAVRFAGAGPSYNAEMDFVNLGNTYDFDPYSPQSAYGSTQAATVSLWLSCGGGDSGLAAGSQNISAAMVWLPNSKLFKRGIVVRNGSLETQEIVAAPSGYKYAWYSGAGSLNSFIDHRTIDQRTRIDSSLGNVWSSRKLRSTTETQALDTIHQHIFFGGTDPSTSYTGGNFTARQRTTFSGGNARFSIDIQARNNDGTFSEISFNGLADKSLAPVADNSVTLGTASNKWSDVRSVVGTFTGPVRVGQFTLATLPSAASFTGYNIDVTDATGGAKFCRSNGTNWLILNTSTIVS